jgi:hypothetical protein
MSAVTPRGRQANSKESSASHPARREGVNLRGLVVVAATLVLGLLLLPAASRAPLAVGATVQNVASPTIAPVSGTTPKGKKSTTTTTVPVRPAAVSVLVANGTSTNGVAGQVTTFLAKLGFATQTAVNATTTVSSTTVYVPTGDTAGGNLVIADLGLSSSSLQPTADPAPVASVGTALVVVIVGPDLVARLPLSAPAPGTSTAALAVGFSPRALD